MDAKYLVVKTQDSFNYPRWAIVVTWTDESRRQCCDTVEIFEDQKEAKRLAKRMQRGYQYLVDTVIAATA